MRIKTLLLSLFALAFISCQNEKHDTPAAKAEGPSPVSVELDMMVYANEGMVNNYNISLDLFHEGNPETTVILENVYGEDWSDYELALRTRILSGKAPDIVDVSVVYRDALINDDLLLDIFPYVEESGLDMNLYFENQFEGLRRGEALYGIPSGALLMGVYINKDLFRQAGQELPGSDWNNSWNWDEFARAAESIRALGTGEKEVYGMTMSFTVGWIIPMLMSNGSGFLTEPDATCSDYSRETGETLSFLKELMFDKGASPDMMQLVTLQPYQYFFNGQVGILIDGNWWMESARDKLGFDWGVVPIPVSKYPATGMYVDAWSVPADSEYPGEAFSVLAFFLEESQQKSGIMKGIPPLKSSAYDIYSTRFENLSAGDIDVWFDGISYGKTPAYFDKWNDFQNESTEILREYSFGRLSDEDALEELCRSYQDNAGE